MYMYMCTFHRLLTLVVDSCALCYPLVVSRLCGSLGYYDVAKEKKISLKLPQPLQVYDRIFHKVTTTDDPIIREVSRFCTVRYMYHYEVSLASVLKLKD